MIRLLATLILATAAHTAVAAQAHFRSGYAACLTEKLFDQFVTAAAQNDRDAIAYLGQNGCILTDHLAAYDAALTGHPKKGVIQARVYLPKGSMEVYAPVEALTVGQ
ncbi:hypothetical protein OVY01_00930 [Robbsia sp. Bb-Pol-6]|uniref:Uncharacterized protein n=1 Tax=Robbsia betulipollinis TaxID=2981849 RepID=A0ABT3ZH21_9BURK|nr:hypothetical protein [Robbsia betulipollinis]MCY0385826.1 hypothetical protein [Robbsia betulipollinis]